MDVSGSRYRYSHTIVPWILDPRKWQAGRLFLWKFFIDQTPQKWRQNRVVSMVGKLVPVKGGIGGIVHPPIGRKNTTYIALIVLAEPGGLYATYHLLREPVSQPLIVLRSLKGFSFVGIFVSGMFYPLFPGTS